MSDNVGYTPGSGAVVAADNVAAVLVQRVKATFGAAGVATDVSASDPLPVSMAAAPLPAGAATETTLAALNAKVPPAGQALTVMTSPTFSFSLASSPTFPTPVAALPSTAPQR